MNFTERIVLDNLLRRENPFEENEEIEYWSRLQWFLDELKEMADLDEFTAHISLTDILAQEFLARRKKSQELFKNRQSKTSVDLSKKVGEQKEFFISYKYLSSFVSDLPQIRSAELRHLREKHADLEDTIEFHDFTEGCIDLCMVKNAPKLAPLIEDYLAKYLTIFKNREIHWDVNVFVWERQREIAEKILLENKEKFGVRFWLGPDNLSLINAVYGNEFRFIETLLIMQNEGELSVYCDCPNVIRGDPYNLSVELLQKNGASDETKKESKIFQFGNCMTDFEEYRIWKEGNEKNGQRLNDAKRRYIWEFCWKHCDAGQQSQELLEKYVHEALSKTKGNIHNTSITRDDIKTLIDLIARYSDASTMDLRKTYIRFQSGVGIEVKSIT